MYRFGILFVYDGILFGCKKIKIIHPARFFSFNFSTHCRRHNEFGESLLARFEYTRRRNVLILYAIHKLIVSPMNRFDCYHNTILCLQL